MIIVLLLFVYKTDVIHQSIIQFYNNNFSLQILSMLTLGFFFKILCLYYTFILKGRQGNYVMCCELAFFYFDLRSDRYYFIQNRYPSG